MQADYRVDSIYVDEETGEIFAKCYDNVYGENFEKYLGNPEEHQSSINASIMLEDSNFSMTDELRNEIISTFGLEDLGHEMTFATDEYDDEIYAGNANGIVTEDELDAKYEVEESFNLREALNRIDIVTSNKFDLRNLYESVELSEEDKKQLATLIYDQEDPSVIYDTLNGKFLESIGMNEEDETSSPVIHKKSDGSYLISSSSGDGYTAFNKNDVCMGHISAHDDNEAKNKFNINKFDESLNEEVGEKITSTIDGSELEINEEDVIPNTRSFKATYTTGDSAGHTYIFVEANDAGVEYLKSLGFEAENMNGDEFIDLPTEVFTGKYEGSYYITRNDFSEYNDLKESLDNDITEVDNGTYIKTSKGRVFLDGKYLDGVVDPNIGFEFNPNSNKVYFYTLDKGTKIKEIDVNSLEDAKKAIKDTIDSGIIDQYNVINEALNSVEGDFEEDSYNKKEVISWLEDHSTAYEDITDFFGSADLSEIDLESILGWIAEHDELYDDFLRFFEIDDDSLVEDLTPGRSIEISDGDGEECPYLIGSSTKKMDIGDRYNLSEDELWATGWIASVQNEEDGPFESFDKIDLFCYDEEKGEEYSLPETPEDIKSKFLKMVNDYINSNNINESLTESSDETWHDVYKQFLDIVDSTYTGGNEEEIAKAVEELYRQHDGEPAWDEAWLRWIDHTLEPGDEGFEEADALYKSELARIRGRKLEESTSSKKTFAQWFDETQCYGDDTEFYPFDNYVKNFPNAEILRNATALDIVKNAHKFYDVYDVDSDDRLKTFIFASEELGVDEDILYKAWLRETPITGVNESFENGSWDTSRVTDLVSHYLTEFDNIPIEQLQKKIWVTMKEEGSKLPDLDTFKQYVADTAAHFYEEIDSLGEGYELSPRIDYNPNHLRDDEGKIMADRWYASKWPDDETGIEQLQGITLDDALKDRKILDHCDTQVRERVYAQLDKYIPLSVDSPMNKEKNESKSIKESAEKRDIFCTDCDTITTQTYKGTFKDGIRTLGRYICDRCGCENEDEPLTESKSINEASLTNSPLSTAGPIPYAVKLLYMMDKFVMDVYDNEGWLMNGVPDGEFEETTADEAQQNYKDHEWLIEDEDSPNGVNWDDFNDFIDTFSNVTESRDYDQEERSRIIDEADTFVREYAKYND